ncbi:leucine-rich repeat protein [Porphyromonas miyakawae]
MKKTTTLFVLLLLSCGAPLLGQSRQEMTHVNNLVSPQVKSAVATNPSILKKQARSTRAAETVDPSKFNTLFEGLYENAFLKAVNLEEIILPKNTKQIRDFAFTGCSALKSVTLPETVEESAPTSFPDQEGLVIYVPTEALKSKLDAIYSFEKTKIVYRKPNASQEISSADLQIACSGNLLKLKTENPSISAFALYSIEGRIIAQGELSPTHEAILSLPSRGTFILYTNNAVAQTIIL